MTVTSATTIGAATNMAYALGIVIGMTLLIWYLRPPVVGNTVSEETRKFWVRKGMREGDLP